MKFKAFLVLGFCASVVTGIELSSAQQVQTVSHKETLAACSDAVKSGFYKTVDECVRALSGNSGNANTPIQQACIDSQKDFATKQTKFRSECGKAGAGGKCEKTAVACDQCNLASEDHPSCAGTLESISDRKDRAETKKMEQEDWVEKLGLAAGGEYDVGAKRGVDYIQIGSCSPIAKSQAKTAQKKLEDLRGDLDNLREQIANKKQDLNQLQVDIQSAQTEYQEARNREEEGFKKALKDSNEKVTQENEALIEQMTTASDAISKLQSAMRQKEVEYYNALAMIEKICEDDAQRKLEARRADQDKKRLSNSLKSQGINQTLTLAAKGRVADDEIYRRKAIAVCKVNDTKYSKPLQLLNNQFKIDLENLEKEIVRMTDIRQKAAEKMQSNSQKYGPEVKELQEKFVKNMTTMEQNFTAKVGQCHAAQGQDQAAFLSQLQNLSSTKQQSRRPKTPNCTGLQGQLVIGQEQMANIEERMREKEDEIAHYQELQETALEVVGVISESDYDYENFTSAAGEFMSAAQSVASSCQCAGCGEAGDELNGTACKAATEALFNFYDTSTCDFDERSAKGFPKPKGAQR